MVKVHNKDPFVFSLDEQECTHRLLLIKNLSEIARITTNYGTTRISVYCPDCGGLIWIHLTSENGRAKDCDFNYIIPDKPYSCHNCVIEGMQASDRITGLDSAGKYMDDEFYEEDDF